MLQNHSPEAAAALRLPFEFWTPSQRAAVLQEPLANFTLGELEALTGLMRRTLGTPMPINETPKESLNWLVRGIRG